MLQRFAIDDLTATPWKNGGGVTREIACWPPGAGLADFDWRISMATIAAGGPFSAFAGIDRTIVLLEGDGVRLRSKDGGIDHLLDTPLAPFSFSGDVPVTCELLGGESTDFNVMVRRGRCRAELHVCTGATELAPPGHGLLLALRGNWAIAAASQDLGTCAPRHGLCWAGPPAAVRARPVGEADALLLALRIEASNL